jgi:AcrR family transcriptional regulator
MNKIYLMNHIYPPRQETTGSLRAEKVFCTKRASGTKMEDILQEAELSKTTLYLNFKNKDELFTLAHLRMLKHDPYVSTE